VEQRYYVYIMTNTSRTLYTGVTNDLQRRVQEHKRGIGSKFTTRYHIISLVYYEPYNRIDAAIAREKEIKTWRRAKKVKLIEDQNPDWRDLSLDWLR
jgi:putative endonuclease